MTSASGSTWRAFATGAFRPFDRHGRLLPRGLQLLQMLGVFFPALVLILFASAPFDLGSYELNEHKVSGPEFLTQGGGITFGSLALFVGTVGFGIWQGRAWTRTALMIGLGVAFVASTAFQASRGSVQWPMQLLSGAFAFLLFYWYLYRKEGTKAYYESLQGRSRSSATA
jgi:hypothetical protein